MVGRFLEYSIATANIRESLDFYSKLGFSQAQVGEAWDHPYAVLTDGRICLGLHQGPDFLPSSTFVMPDLLKHLDRLERMGVDIEFRRLAGDEFNEVAWFDPSGNLVRLVEARTFSPSTRRSGETSLCGYFLEIALPAPDFALAKSHWEALGFVGMDEPDALLPHVSCTSDTIDIGLYGPISVPAPTLMFDVDGFRDTLERLDAVGITPGGRVPAPLRHLPVAMLMAPEGTPILLAGIGRE